MWVPTSEAAIRERAQAGDLSETATFEGKRELPMAAKSKDLALDVAALANEGGVILCGLGEDEAKRLTILAPFALAGVAERIDSIVRTAISEPPTIEIKVIPSEADPTVGYIVMAVPPSPRAPHMVVKDKDYRYYGRSATGNVRLMRVKSPGCTRAVSSGRSIVKSCSTRRSLAHPYNPTAISASYTLWLEL